MLEPEQAPPAGIPSVNINLTNQGMVISTVAAVIDENTMNQVVIKWLEAHPALLADIAKQAATVKQNELQLIRHIGATRND